MALTIEEVRKIAALARLRFSPEEEATLGGQLAKVVDYIDQLAAFAPATAGTAESPGTAENPAIGELGLGPGREADDEPQECLPRERFLANAPAAQDGFLLVPEVK